MLRNLDEGLENSLFFEKSFTRLSEPVLRHNRCVETHPPNPGRRFKRHVRKTKRITFLNSSHFISARKSVLHEPSEMRRSFVEDCVYLKEKKKKSILRNRIETKIR